MCVDRREFFRLAASGVGAVAVGSAVEPAVAAQAQEVPASIRALRSMTDDVQPITRDERQGRMERARQLMVDNDIAAIYIEPSTTLYYYTGVRWSGGERMFALVLPARGDAAIVCPAFEEERARELIWSTDDVRTWEEHESPYELVAGILRDRGVTSGKVGIEETTRFFLFDGIRHAAPGVELVSADPVTVGCRVIKSAHELALMQKANEITLAAYKAAAATLYEGMTQFEFSRNVSAAMQALGAGGGASVQFGEYSAYPHGSRTPQRLEEGNIVMMDGGCKVDGYSSDITRTIVYGTPSQKQRDVWNIEREAQDAAFATARPGVPCEDVDAAARKVITDAGYGPGYKYFTHRVGHGIGLDGHEWTYLVKGNRTPLAPGMCFSDEPGIYIYGEFGVRLEDCMHITEDGARMFTPQSPSIDDPFGNV